MKRTRIKDMLLGGVLTLALGAMVLPTLASQGNKTLTVSYQDIKLVVDGQTITPRDSKGNVAEPFIFNGTTYLPVRAVGEALGLEVDWNGKNNTVTLTSPTQSGSNQQPSGDYIGEAKAKQIALEDAGLSESKVNFYRTKLDREDGRMVYEVEFYAGNTEYDYEIDAVSGKIISKDFDIEGYTIPDQPNSRQQITAEQARAAALKHAGIRAADAKFVKTELDYDDGRMEYEVEFYADGWEYEYTIDAGTGAVLSYDKDR